MCVFSVVYRVLPECPIFILTNRDESTERPTNPPRTFPAPQGDVQWFGGTDARAGGTWLGINQHGLIAAITNRTRESAPLNPRSRGLLCRDVMSFVKASQAVEFVFQELARQLYAGFNLIVLDANSFWVVESADGRRATQLEAGIHTIGNAPQAEHTARDARTHALVEEMIRGRNGCMSLIERSKQILSAHADGKLPAVCLHGDGWGTVGSTIVALPDDLRQAQYHYAAGPPCRTPFVDHSVELREILAQRPTREARMTKPE